MRFFPPLHDWLTTNKLSSEFVLSDMDDFLISFYYKFICNPESPAEFLALSFFQYTGIDELNK